MLLVLILRINDLLLRVVMETYLQIIVVCNEQYLLEGEFTLLEPRPYLDRRRLIVLDPSNPPLTPSTKTFRMSGIYGTLHISTAGISLHLTPKQADVL